MRIIKAMVAGATGLFIFITLLSLLIPAHPKVSRTIMINTLSTEKVMSQLTDLANWKKWHPVFSSQAVSVLPGKISSGKGAECDVIYNAKSTHVTIMSVDTSSVIIEFKSQGENDITNQLIISAVQPMQQTKVDWVATTHLQWYPWQKFFAIFIDKLTGPGYEAALQALKNHVEKE